VDPPYSFRYHVYKWNPRTSCTRSLYGIAEPYDNQERGNQSYALPPPFSQSLERKFDITGGSDYFEYRRKEIGVL